MLVEILRNISLLKRKPAQDLTVSLRLSAAIGFLCLYFDCQDWFVRSAGARRARQILEREQ
jgi:hypothetical protein